MTGVQTCALPIFVTFHPAYLLRKPDQKKFSWEDLKIIRKEIDKQNIAI